MTWAQPDWWPLLLLPAIAALLAWRAVRSGHALLGRLVSPAIVSELSGEVDHARRRIKAAMIAAGVLLCTAALLGPQWGLRWHEVTRRGIDVLLVLDVSRSMLAQDLRPNRLERAKLAIEELTQRLDGDRVGLVLFAGSSFVQCPLTVDYGAFLLTLRAARPEEIPRGGTDLAGALREAAGAFAAGEGSRAVVVISDGEDHAGGAVQASAELASQGVRVFCIGVGSPDGELIPLVTPEQGTAFLKDREGRPVKSRLDESTLRQVAEAGRGAYVRAGAVSFGLDTLYRDYLQAMAQQEFEHSMQQQREARFQWFLAPGFLLLVLELVISDRRRLEARAA